MKKTVVEKISALVVIFISFAGVSSSQESDSVELVFEGTFLGPGPFPESGQRWYAISRAESTITLAETIVEVTEVPHQCTGAATRITALDADDPLFLMRGSSLFQPGVLDSVHEDARFLYPAEQLPLRLDSGEWFVFLAYGSATPAGVSDYVVQLSHKSAMQTLAEFSQVDIDGRPKLVWAGDLDRDGRLDALLDLTTHYAGHLYVLFLSSAARRGQLVERVAEFPVSGC